MTFTQLLQTLVAVFKIKYYWTGKFEIVTKIVKCIIYYSVQYTKQFYYLSVIILVSLMKMRFHTIRQMASTRLKISILSFNAYENTALGLKYSIDADKVKVLKF